jgi:hypothetical protein
MTGRKRVDGRLEKGDVMLLGILVIAVIVFVLLRFRRR